MSDPVEIVRLGHSGHGATADGLFVPYALPGELVHIAREGERARLLDIVRPSPSRVEPICQHFTRCGGCAVQHLAPRAYLDWKRHLVIDALSQRGFEGVHVADIRGVLPGTRRRAMMKGKKSKTTEIGFYEPESHTLVDVFSCPVLLPELERLIAPLRAALKDLLRGGETAELHMTATDSGVDLSLSWRRARDANVLMDLGDLARELDLARFTWNNEPISISRPPVLRVGRFTVSLPPAPFLQPTREGEKILQELVLQGVGDAKRIADLFCGCGTFALALAEGREIRAVDDSPAMIEALAAATRTSGAKFRTEQRDLNRRPFMASEFAGFDAVVLDPPRPGAKPQAIQIAASSVPRVVYVSCNAASFARDARILVNSGYRLESVTPVDQFLWSPHIEMVGLFSR